MQMSSLRLINAILSEASPTLEGFQIWRVWRPEGPRTPRRSVHFQAPSSAVTSFCCCCCLYWKIKSQIESTLSFPVASGERCGAGHALVMGHWLTFAPWHHHVWALQLLLLPLTACRRCCFCCCCSPLELFLFIVSQQPAIIALLQAALCIITPFSV